MIKNLRNRKLFLKYNSTRLMQIVYKRFKSSIVNLFPLNFKRDF